MASSIMTWRIPDLCMCVPQKHLIIDLYPSNTTTLHDEEVLFLFWPSLKDGEFILTFFSSPNTMICQKQEFINNSNKIFRVFFIHSCAADFFRTYLYWFIIKNYYTSKISYTYKINLPHQSLKIQTNYFLKCYFFNLMLQI